MRREAIAEVEIMGQMIGLYCKKKHGRGAPLCPQCQQLYDYGVERIERCPKRETKTFCSTCTIHCYRAEMRGQMREVMQFSGPRMLLYRPKLAVAHIINTFKHRSRQ